MISSVREAAAVEAWAGVADGTRTRVSAPQSTGTLRPLVQQRPLYAVTCH
jgi:hypothetical protein